MVEALDGAAGLLELSPAELEEVEGGFLIFAGAALIGLGTGILVGVAIWG